MPLVRVELFERRLTPELESKSDRPFDQGGRSSASRGTRAGKSTPGRSWRATTPPLGPQWQTVGRVVGRHGVLQPGRIRHTVAFRLENIPTGRRRSASSWTRPRCGLAAIPGVEAFELLREISPKNEYRFGISMEFADRAAHEGLQQPSGACPVRPGALARLRSVISSKWTPSRCLTPKRCQTTLVTPPAACAGAWRPVRAGAGVVDRIVDPAQLRFGELESRPAPSRRHDGAGGRRRSPR